MRGAPQKGLAVAIFRIKAVISRLACGRPVRLLLEIHAQKRRKPFRCQDTTVSGLTITRTPILPGPGQSHPEQTIRASQPRPRALPLEDRELLARTLGTDLPDAPRQLLQLFRSARAGDLVLAARLGADFRDAWEIPEHKAGHGSLIADHMAVPIAASIPLPAGPLRTVDLMPTMLERLDVIPPAGIDGVAFSTLMRPAALVG